MSQLANRRKWFERNEQAEQLEAQGDRLGALRLYEENAAEDCDVAYTYERMAALYRSMERFDREIESLEKAVEIEERRGPSAQVIRLKQRLETSKQVRERSEPRRAPTSQEPVEGTTRRKAVKRKEKKGCLAVVVVVAASAGLVLSLVA